MDYEAWCALSWEDRKARFLDGLFYGFAIPCNKSTADGNTIRSEKVLKFNKSALKDIILEDSKARQRKEHEERYNKLLAHYHNPYNIENEISYWEE